MGAGNTQHTTTNKYQSHTITEDACDLRSDQAVLIQVQGFEFGVWSIQVSVNQAVLERRGSRKRAVACGTHHGRHGPEHSKRPNSTLPDLARDVPASVMQSEVQARMVRESVSVKESGGRSISSQGLCVASEFNRRYEDKGSHRVVRKESREIQGCRSRESRIESRMYESRG